ncbi:MAG: hypothetical protein ABII97_02830 [Patescibacteria group bacterium]
MKDVKPIIKASHKGEILYKKDPMEFLFEQELAVQVGNGLFVTKGFLVEILNKIENLICEIAKKVGAEFVSVPCLLSMGNVKKSNYLDSFKNQALMIHSFENEKCEGMCSPTVCYHYFGSLADKQMKKNHAVSALGKCTRKEEGELNNFARLTNFTMREIIFLGTEEYCQKKKDEVLKLTQEMLDGVFDLTYDITTASDPFFGDNSQLKQKSQLVSESKYELQALLPYSNKTSSVGSFNLHGKVFYDRFNISSKEPELTFSGCVGWGYERLLYSILSQKGTDFSSPYYKKLCKSC